MNMRFFLLFAFVSGLLCADELEDFVITFHVWHQVTCIEDPYWDATRAVANKLYYDAWREKKSAEQFFKRYCELMKIKPKSDGEGYRAWALYSALSENYKVTVADAKNKINDCAYRERSDNFEQQLEYAGVIWVTKEQEDRFWQGKLNE